MTTCTEFRIPGTQHYIKRFSMGAGRCQWCGQERRRLYDYRGPTALDYRLNRPTRGFCNRKCYSAFTW
jgi:hypothetical protein